MTPSTFPVTSDTQLVIKELDGDLVIQGWAREEVQILGNALEPEQKAKTISLQLEGDTHLSVPHHLKVRIETISGDLVIRNLSQGLEIDSVGGDTSLQNTAAVTIAEIGGDLHAVRVLGDLIVNKLGGDGKARDVGGQLSLDAGGDLEINAFSRGAALSTGGDAVLVFDPLPWQVYQVHSDGDLTVYLPPSAAVALEMKSGAEQITVNLSDYDQVIEARDHTLQIGENGAPLQLSAGGSVRILESLSGPQRAGSPPESFWYVDQLLRDFSHQTARQLEGQLDSLEKDLQQALTGLSASLDSSGLTEQKLEELKVRLRESTHRAAQKTKIAAQKAEQKIHQSITKAQQKARSFQEKNKDFNLEEFLFGEKSSPSSADQERMLILKMLEEQKISSAEAAALINALEKKD